MSNLDEMRDRLSINTLDQDNRKKLYKDLTNAGGRVIDLDGKLQGIKASNNGSDKEITKHNIRGSEIQNPFRVPVNNKNRIKIEKRKSSVSWITLFWLRLNCKFSNIFGFGANTFSYTFKFLISKKLYNDFLSLRLYLNPIFKSISPQTLQFRKKYYQYDNLMDYELAYRVYTLFDNNLFLQLQNSMEISVNESEKDIKKLFATLYLLYKYNTQLKIALISILQSFNKEFPSFAYKEVSIKNINGIFDELWGKIYNLLEQLISYYLNNYNYLNNKSDTLLEYLEIDNNDLEIGSFADEWKRQYLMEDLTRDLEEDEKSEIETHRTIYPNDIVEKGCVFIQKNIDFKTYYNQFSEFGDLRALFEKTDRVFYAYVLVDYFDSEFTFLWTGNYINFYTVTAGSALGRFDPKKEFFILNTKINQFYELVNEYLRVVYSISKIKNSSNNRSQINFLELRLKEVSKNSFNIRKNLVQIALEFSILIEKILKTKNTDDSLIGNWDEQIKVNGKNKNNKIVNDKTILEILQIVYEYTNAMGWLLNYSDLSGLGTDMSKPEVLTDELLNENET